jgi:opacity protein-like surface antigen
MMRIHILAVAAIAWLAGASEVRAQARSTAPSSTEDHGYIEVVGQSAFGNVTSQSYGVEVGGTVARNVQVFGELGNIRNVATAEISQSAQTIAAALTLVQPAAVTYSVKQPVLFFGGGVKLLFPLEQSKVRPYVLGGFGVARVKNDVAFQFGGTDATTSLAQYVTIGTDLSGEVTKPMLTLGGGVVWPAWQRLIIDFNYRFGRIFTDTQATNVSRAGLGIGVSF